MPLSSYYPAIEVLIDVESVSSCKGDVEVSIFLNNVLMFTSLKNFDSRVDRLGAFQPEAASDHIGHAQSSSFQPFH